MVGDKNLKVFMPWVNFGAKQRVELLSFWDTLPGWLSIVLVYWLSTEDSCKLKSLLKLIKIAPLNFVYCSKHWQQCLLMQCDIDQAVKNNKQTSWWSPLKITSSSSVVGAILSWITFAASVWPPAKYSAHLNEILRRNNRSFQLIITFLLLILCWINFVHPLNPSIVFIIFVHILQICKHNSEAHH